LLRPGVGCFGLESAPSAWSRLLPLWPLQESVSTLSGLARNRSLRQQESAPFLLSLGRPLQESASSSLSGQASAGVGSLPRGLTGCTTGSTAVGLGRMRQESVASLCVQDRSRLLTSLARTGVGCSPLCLGQESDPCSSVWPGCRSLCSSVWTGLSWSLVSLLQCLDWLLRCLHWLLCAGGLVFGCLLQWSSFCQLLVVLVVNSWLHWCLPQSVHHSAHLVA